MSRRNPWGEFFQNFNAAYDTGNKVALQIGMAKAANVKPETLTRTDLTETTPNRDDMVYDADTGQYMPKYLDSNGQPTEQALAQLNTPADGTSEAPNGVLPTFDAKTSTRYKMGEKEQDEPFTPEQVDAQRLRNQADVYTKFGMAERAAGIHGLAKTREEEGVTNQIRTAATSGMKNTKDMRDEEKMFAMSKNMYEAAVRLNRPDLATGYYNQMTQNRDALLARATDRADRVYRSTGNISGFVDSYNRYVADGQTIDQFKRNEDGSYTFTINDGKGSTRDTSVSKERLPEYLMALRDPKRIADIEAKRAEILFKAQADSQEAMNKPIVGKHGDVVMVPITGQQTTLGGDTPRFNVKEAGPILDDSRKILSQIKGNAKFGSIPGQVEWTPAGASKIVTAERLFMKNPNLTPAQLAEIADKGTTGTAVVEVGGKQQRVPAVSYGGRTFVLGGEAGNETPQSAPAPSPTGRAGRPATPQQSVSGKISGGMQKPSATPTPADFPRVSAEQQASRDGERRAILQRELETYPKDGSDARRALEDEARRAGILVPA